MTLFKRGELSLCSMMPRLWECFYNVGFGPTCFPTCGPTCGVVCWDEVNNLSSWRSQESVVAYGNVIHRNGKMLFSYSRCQPGKSIQYFEAIFRRHIQIYKQNEFSWDWLTGGADTKWWIARGSLIFFSFFLFLRPIVGLISVFNDTNEVLRFLHDLPFWE